MKVDEVIIKLCSERGYDPSQINDYYTLLEQLECIKKLLETYPNQQYFTVKAYTYTASTKMYSFKISDVNNYGRQINVGDILIVSLANGVLELAQISTLVTTAETGEAIDVGQLTGKNGTDGKGIENVDKIEIAEGNSVVSIENGFQVDISAQFKDIAGDLLTNATGHIALPIKAGNGISADVSSDGTKIEIRLGDTIKLSNGQEITFIRNDTGQAMFVITKDGININPSEEDTTCEIFASGQSGNSFYNDNVKIKGSVILDCNDLPSFTYPDFTYYDMSEFPKSAQNGIFTVDNSYVYFINSKKIGLLFNNEYYYPMDKQHTTGTMVYTHVGYESDQLIIKTITITISTNSWVLTVVKPKFYSTAYVIYIGDTLQETGEQPRGVLYSVLATGASNAELQSITDNIYLPVTGYYRVGTVTPAVYKTACAIDAMTENKVNVYFTDGTSKELYYSIEDSYNA